MEEKIILECYECAAKFKVSPSLLGHEGKKVRCAHCRHEWIAKAPLEGPVASPEQPTQLNPEDTQPLLPGTASSLIAESAKKEKLFFRAPLENRSSFLSNLFLILALLFAISSFLYLGRYKIVELIPNTRALYENLDIDVGEDFKVFTLSDLTHSKILQNETSSILVRGQLINTSPKTVNAPNVVVSVRGTGNCPTSTWKDKLFSGDTDQEDGQCTLTQWTVQITDGTLSPSQSVPIETTRPINPSWNITHVFLDFARR